MICIRRLASTIVGACLLCANFVSANEIPQSVDDALSKLNEALEHQEDYAKLREQRIDSLSAVASKKQGLEKAYEFAKIGDEYSHYQIDSAMVYYHQAAALCKNNGDDNGYKEFTLRHSASMTKMGAVIEAVAEFDSIDPDSLDADLKKVYYDCGNQVFFYLASTYPILPKRNEFAQRGRAMTEALVEVLDDPEERDYHQAELYFFTDDKVKLKAQCKGLLNRIPMTHPVFAKTASMLGDYYVTEENGEDNALYYKTLAAISDVLTATREEMALQKVGTCLYDRGDIELAYTCLMKSLDNAVKSGSKIHMIAASESVPLIASAFQEQDDRKLTILIWLVVALAIALVIIVATLFFLHRKMVATNKMKSLLKEANTQKEAFINQFLNLCAIYMEKLEEFNRLASRKIKAGQVEDLYATIKSGKMLDDQNKLFCEVFDKAFTRIYPSFVSGVNALLQPDKQIVLNDKELLNTELRILAFMRLGVEDSSQVARFLQLSLNTIYTYRNKLKNKANNRNTFEQDVMKIERID